jgi:nucleoside-diphosphate-sugar epimerase
LTDLGSKVIVIDDFTSGHRWNLPDDIELLKSDVADSQALAEGLDADPAVVFHLAAFFANQNSVEHPHADLDTNGHGTVNVLDACSKRDCVERVVYASSSCVYDQSMEIPFVESEEIRLTKSTPYEITKTMGEAYCNYYHDKQGVDVTRARIFNSYGPGEVPGQYRNVIPNFVALAKQGKPLPITGSGDETRDFTYVSDIVDGLLALGEHPVASGEVYNLGRGEETTIQKLADTINKLVGNAAGVEYEPRRDWDDTDRRCANINKAREDLDYRPTVDLETGLAETVAWFDEYWERIREFADE